jgi:hypothetical protein
VRAAHDDELRQLNKRFTHAVDSSWPVVRNGVDSRVFERRELTFGDACGERWVAARVVEEFVHNGDETAIRRQVHVLCPGPELTTRENALATESGRSQSIALFKLGLSLRAIWSVAARSGATPKSIVPTGNGGALALPESDPHDLAVARALLPPRQTQKRRNQRITTIPATLMPSAGVRRPRMSRFGGTATT